MLVGESSESGRSWWSLAVSLTAWAVLWEVYILVVYSTTGFSLGYAAAVSARSVGLAALLGWAGGRVFRRFRWPGQASFRFLAAHLLGAVAYAFLWVTLSDLVEAFVREALRSWPPSGKSSRVQLGCSRSITWIFVPRPVRSQNSSVRPSGLGAGPVWITASLKVSASGTPPVTGMRKTFVYAW